MEVPIMADNTFTATERLYLDADGKVVKADDPKRRSLLVGVGGTMPMDRARALGLVAEPKAEQPAANKAVKPAAVSNKAAK
jgi:hypothetical protein